jgi:phosphomannomutase
MEIFKAYDIRGKYGADGINPNLAYKVGIAFARFTTGATCIVGHDARAHSRELYEAAIRGLTKAGKKVTGIGLVSTPALHFLQVKKGFDCGLMITASHNPKEYHGFKLFDGKGGSISYEKGLDKIKELVLAMKVEDPRTTVQQDEHGLLAEYIGFLAGIAGSGTHSLVAAIDVSNGSAGEETELLAKQIGLNATVLNGNPDGSFPVHGPNPLEEKSREFISAKVKELHADFGVTLDGDGDRILFTDEKGNTIDNYFMSALFSEELLAGKKGEAIVYDLISSRVLPERIAELGGKPVVSRVGYTHLYDKMVGEKALFGAEASGHVYFRVTNSFYTESATYAILLLLKLLERRKQPLSSLIAPLRARYYQAPEINREIHDKEAAMKRVEAEFRRCTIDKLDGVSVDAGDYWFNVRPSNTEPLLRIRLEAKNKSAADEALKILEKLIESA